MIPHKKNYIKIFTQGTTSKKRLEIRFIISVTNTIFQMVISMEKK